MAAFSIGVVILVLLVLWVVPKLQVRSADLEAKDRLDLEIKARAVLAQLIVGSLLLFTFYATWNSIELSRQALDVSRANIDLTRQSFALDRDSRLAGRYLNAIEMLGSSSEDIEATIPRRLGGIYALERLAAESETHYEPAIKVLAGYIRSRRPLTSSRQAKVVSGPPPDVAAAVDVLSHRSHSYENGERFIIDLSQSDLRGVRIVAADFRGAFFYKSDLSDSILASTTFDKANFNGCILRGARLNHTDLRGAILKRADLKGALYDEATRWPEDIDPVEMGAVLWDDPQIAERLGASSQSQK